jgi:ATP phosphoribosyltransferase
VDLVSSGKTLKENGLVEVEVIAEVSARLIANRAAFKTRAAQVAPLVEAFRAAVNPPSRLREGTGVGSTAEPSAPVHIAPTPQSPPASGRGG